MTRSPSRLRGLTPTTDSRSRRVPSTAPSSADQERSPFSLRVPSPIARLPHRTMDTLEPSKNAPDMMASSFTDQLNGGCASKSTTVPQSYRTPATSCNGTPTKPQTSLRANWGSSAHASVFVDKGHSASHNGSGAAMGSKKLKAIAVARGQLRVDVNNRERLREIADTFYEQLKGLSG